VPAGDGPFTIDVELRFQVISFRWAENLKPYDSVETNRFVGYYQSMSSTSSEMLARASADVHVRAGDILGSGTVGTGCLLETKEATLGRYLEPGDVVTLAIERLGELRNPIVGHPG